MMGQTGREGRKARGLVRVYAWMMLLAAALALAAAGYVTHSSRSYESTAEIVVQPTVSRSGAFLSPSMPTEQRVATSGTVAGRAARLLGIPRAQALEAVKVAVPVDTNVLQVTYTAASARKAFAGAQMFAEEYLNYRNPTADGEKPVAQLMTPATLPVKPVAPDYALVFGVSLIGGLVLGFGFAYLWDRLRGRLRTVDDVRTHTGLEVLASVPRLPRPAVDAEPFTARSAATFDQLVARVPGLLERREDLALLITGATAGSGTSTVALETALALTRLGRRVVLVGPDPSAAAQGDRPVPGVPAEDRLTSTLTGHTLRETGVPGLRIADPGDRHPDAAGGPGLDGLELLLRTLALDSIVVIDGPPADRAAALGFVADRVLLTVDVRHGLRSSAEAAVEALRHSGDKLVGCVATMPVSRRRRWWDDQQRPEPAPVPDESHDLAPVRKPALGSLARPPRPARPATRSENGLAHLGLVLVLAVAALAVSLVSVAPAVLRKDGAPNDDWAKGAPPAAGYFKTLPPGAWRTLPGDKACAAQVHRTGWEPRPSNRRANMTMPDRQRVRAALAARPRGAHGSYDARWNTWLLRRVDGQHTGTTDENIQWAACKWGISDNLLRAIAAAESTWFQYLVDPATGRCVEQRGCGDVATSPTPASRVFCDTISRYGRNYVRDYGPGRCPRTFSMMGVMSWQDPKWGHMRDNQNGTFPFSRNSTAFALDFIGSFLRGCQEGWLRWLHNTGDYKRGEIWGCVGVWYAGTWENSVAKEYRARVRDLYDRRIWLERDWAEQLHSPFG